MTMQEFDLLAGLSAFIAIVAGIWNYASFAVDWFFRLFVTEYRTDWELGNIVLVYLTKHKKPGRSKVKYHDTIMIFVRPLEKVQRVVMEYYNQSKITLWMGWKPIWFKNTMSDDDSNVPESQGMVFMAIRGTVDWEQVLLDAVAMDNAIRDVRSNEDKDSRFCVIKCFGGDNEEETDVGMARSTAPSASRGILNQSQASRPLRWEVEDLGAPHEMSSLDMLSLSPEQQDLVREIRFWYDSEEWYKSHGIPWRRGYSFVGPTGTGKTSLSRGVAEDLGIPLYVFDLGSMSNPQFSMAWDRVTGSSTPAIVLLEDIDGVFHGRKNVAPGSKLTFDCLLNCIDGAERPDGLMLIMTTNNPELLEAALVRPGRVDRMVTFHPLDLAGRIKLATRIVEDKEVAAQLANEAANDSAAEFQERCFRYALSRRYAERLQDDAT